MKLTELYNNKKCVFSFECFPPKQTANYESMKNTLREMARLSPDFISVTYGAGGSAGGVSSLDIASFIKNELGIESVAHILCMGSNIESITQTAAALQSAGVENVLALRGDRTPLRPESPDFKHASDLAAFLRESTNLDIAGACYPEGHPESATPADDLRGLKIKQDSGVTHFMTQLFFDNNAYYRFLNRARKAEVSAPISAGVMPIVRTSQIERTVSLSSASMPSEFTKMIARWQGDDDGLYKAGIDYAVSQLRDLIENGADGVHIYAMNNADVAAKVYEGIKDLL